MSLSHWARLLAWLAAETTALVAVAALLHFWLRSPRVRRTIWRTGLASVALVWLVELSGMRARWPSQGSWEHHYVITSLEAPSSTHQAQAVDQRTEVTLGDRKDETIRETSRTNDVPTSLPLWIWLGGSALLLARFCLARVWLAARRRVAAPADAESLALIARWQTSFGLRRVQSQIWPGLRGPVAFGIFRPTIALPPDFATRFSNGERAAMLAHEMAHLAACDPFWWMVSDAIIALAWWHPLVWWARGQLQSASEAAADEASALLPGGAHALAECLVRLGRDLTAAGPARALGIGGNGPRSQLAARIERLLAGPRAWQPMSAWARWIPQFFATVIALASVSLPIQTGLSGSILAVLASATPSRADESPSQRTPVAITNLEVVVKDGLPNTMSDVLFWRSLMHPPDLDKNQRDDMILVLSPGDPTNLVQEIQKVLLPGSSMLKVENRPQIIIYLTDTKKETAAIKAVCKRLYANRSKDLVKAENLSASASSASVESAPVMPSSEASEPASNQNLRKQEEHVLRVVHVEHGDPTNITHEVEGTLRPGSTIIPDERTHSLIVRATKEEMPGVMTSISKLDTSKQETSVEVQAPSAPAIQESTKEKTTNPSPQILLEVQFVILTERGSDDIGLDWIFGFTPTNNPAMQTNSDWVLGVQPVSIPPGPTNQGWSQRQTTRDTHPMNLVIDHLRTEGQSIILKPEQFAALHARVARQADILASPRCITLSGREACIAVQDINSVVTGVKATAGSEDEPPSVNYSTDTVATGLTVDVLPTLEAGGQCHLRVQASDTAFLCYDKYGKDFGAVSVPGGKPIGYQVPHPHFRAVETDAEDTLPMGQTLALRGPLWTETVKTKGHFLFPSKTKTVRQRLYVFVTPTKLSPTGLKE